MDQQIRLLFVDDEADFVEYMQKRLKRHDIEVQSYVDPVEALESTEGVSFDVALLDLKMPGLDGEELLRRLRARDPSLEVIILTGHGSIESAFRTSREGAYEYLQKPCDFDELVRSICSAYAKRITALDAQRAPEVKSLFERMLHSRPVDLLFKLKAMENDVERTLAASAMAEGGDPETAAQMMKSKSKSKKNENK